MGVDMFFVLSGYTMMLTWRDGVWDFLKRRFLRIYPAFFVAVVIWSAINRPSADEIPGHLFFVNNMDPVHIKSINVVFWSLAVEMQFYMLFPLMMVLSWRSWIALAVLSVGFIRIMGWHARWTVHRVLTENPIGFLPLFLIGMALCEGRFRWLPRLLPVSALLFWLPEPELGPFHMSRRMDLRRPSTIGLASCSMYLHSILYRPVGIEDPRLGAGFALVVVYLACPLLERPLGRVLRPRRRDGARRSEEQPTLS